jgi:hypothetical protein
MEKRIYGTARGDNLSDVESSSPLAILRADNVSASAITGDSELY